MGGKLRFAVRRDWPLLTALVVMCATVTWLYVLCLRGTQGHFVYPIDDVYIHMAVAKNLAGHGVWGITPYAFSCSTSSILWPLVLAAFYLFLGPVELVPLALNVLVAALALLVVHVLLTKWRLPGGYVLFALLGVFFLTPFPALIFTGMEHSLQVVASILLVYFAAEEIVREKDQSSGASLTWLYIFAALSTLIRYEGLFLVLPICVLLFIRRRWRDSVSVGLSAVLPVIVYGAASASQGWFWLPNSVFLKGNIPSAFRAEGIASSVYGTFRWMPRSAHILSLLVALAVLLVLWLHQEKRFWKRSSVMIVIVMVATVLHLRFAGLGWFSRYEAYLVALGIFVGAVAGFEYTRVPPGPAAYSNASVLLKIAAGLLILYPLGPLWTRARYALWRIPRASRNNYEQFYQAGLFLKQYYRDAPVVMADIGEASFLGDTRLQDLQGLGSIDVARERIKGFLSADQIDQLTKTAGVKIGILPEELFRNGNIAFDGLPAKWTRVGQWTISNNVVSDDETLSFFAVNPQEKHRLIDCLRQFGERLPADVVQAGDYTLRAPPSQAMATGRSEPHPH